MYVPTNIYLLYRPTRWSDTSKKTEITVYGALMSQKKKRCLSLAFPVINMVSADQGYFLL